MIYLTTGGNGAGKTLFTLKDVREQQIKEGRPVYYHGFTPKQQLKDWGWQEFDPKQWQALPDGSICVMDECQNEFPAKIQGELPEYINAVAQFRRKRGFDFWMITPHPSLINVNIRRLIESPSWHRHLKRTFGSDMVSELRFNYAELRCEQPSAGSRGQVSMRAYPKEVYEWYESASLHTGKKRLPKQVWMLLAFFVLVPVLLFLAYKNVMSTVVKDEKPQAKASVGAAYSPNGSSSSGSNKTGLTVGEYLAVRTARVPDFPHTAPAYDEVTKPVYAPYPAACIHSPARKVCQCYSQQGTVLQTSNDTCMQIVKNGFFVDWSQQESQQAQQQQKQLQQAQPLMVNADSVRVEPKPVKVAEMAKPKEAPSGQPVSEWQQALARRNAQVRSSFEDR